jgi:uncharacterized protein (DUF488 family)
MSVEFNIGDHVGSNSEAGRGQGTIRQQATRQYTIGHSTRPIDEFVALLEAHGIGKVVDVRRIPRSRHNPQYNQTALGRSLNTAHIRYRHKEELGFIAVRHS